MTQGCTLAGGIGVHVDTCSQWNGLYYLAAHFVQSSGVKICANAVVEGGGIVKGSRERKSRRATWALRG